MKPISAYFLVGPTAAGKSAVAHRIALARGFDILSADAMQVYRGMDIGTAKPTREEQAAVKYSGIDLVDPAQPFSVAEYVQAAVDVIGRISAAGRRCIVVGGSGLYVKGLTHGLTALPPADPEVRPRVQALYSEGGVAAIRDQLRAMRPDLFEGLPDKRNPRRIMRALELAHLGVPVPPSNWKPRGAGPPIPGLLPAREFLSECIKTRVERMYEQGLADEVKRLLASGLADTPTARHAIGYAEAIEFVQGRASLEEAMAQTVLRTARLAKRQLTWFRHQANVQWILVDRKMDGDTIMQSVLSLWEQHGPTPIVSAN